MYHTGLHWYDLYFLIVSLWLLGTSQIKLSALQEGVSGTWKVSQCQLKFTSDLSIIFFWYYSLLLFADAEKIPYNYTISYLLFFSFTDNQKRRCQEETMVLIHTFLWQIKMLMVMLTDLQTVTVCYISVMSRNIYYEKYWFWNNL